MDERESRKFPKSIQGLQMPNVKYLGLGSLDVAAYENICLIKENFRVSASCFLKTSHRFVGRFMFKLATPGVDV